MFEIDFLLMNGKHKRNEVGKNGRRVEEKKTFGNGDDVKLGWMFIRRPGCEIPIRFT